MSGWYYMKEGVLSDSQIGPLSNTEFLQLAFDGKLKLKSKVIHPELTNNQWVLLGQIPDSKKQLDAGQLERRVTANAARSAKERAKQELAVDKARMQLESPFQAEIVGASLREKSQAAAKSLAKFAKTRDGIIVLLFAFLFGGPLLICCFLSLATTTSRQGRTVAPQLQPTKEVVVYAPINDMICATDPKFLDSSPLVAPARFARIDAGTEVVIVDVGGMFSGNLYWGLSAGGRIRIYVYRETFEQKFKQVRTIQR